jgi:predicted histone-like DNA-binding protein
MSVKYTISQKGNPSKQGKPEKWYANAKSDKSVTLKEVSKEIEQYSRVNHTTTLIVLNALTQILCNHLSKGETVRLGSFGSFQITLSSEGAESAAKFNSSYIKKGKIVFRPSTDIKEMLSNLKFEKL